MRSRASRLRTSTQLIPLPDPRPEGISPVDRAAGTGRCDAAREPLHADAGHGAAQFVDANPTWDGRGVTIGIVDTGVSLDHPSLTTTSTGERKIVDWVTGTDPVTDGDPTWINMAAQVSGATFTFERRDLHRSGRGFLPDRRVQRGDPTLRRRVRQRSVNRDLNRDGDAADIFAVLWNERPAGLVGHGPEPSFADQTAMRDYAVNFDVGYFGTDNAATAVADRVPFVVQTDGKNKYVNLGIVSGAHGSHVAGIAAGNRLFGGQMSGAAPGAKIVSSRACLFVAGCTAHALFEGMIYVAKQKNVDVINMSIGGLPALNDGNNARCALYDRLIEQSNVQMFISAGQQRPGINTAGDPGLCRRSLGHGRVHHVRDVPAGLRHADAVHATTCTTSAPAVLARTAASRRARRAGRGDLVDPDVAGAGSGHVHAAAGLRALQRHLDGGAAGDRRRGAARERGEAGRRRSTSRTRSGRR